MLWIFWKIMHVHACVSRSFAWVIQLECARRARRTKLRSLKDLQLEFRARRAPWLLVILTYLYLSHRGCRAHFMKLLTQITCKNWIFIGNIYGGAGVKGSRSTLWFCEEISEHFFLEKFVWYLDIFVSPWRRYRCDDLRYPAIRVGGTKQDERRTNLTIFNAQKPDMLGTDNNHSRWMSDSFQRF